LLLRGIDDAETAQRYLAPSLADLHAPYSMTGMKFAIDRLDAAIERKEGILIYGDYDVDGTTAIVILKTAIELCGGAADFHVPHRQRSGASTELLHESGCHRNHRGCRTAQRGESRLHQAWPGCPPPRRQSRTEGAARNGANSGYPFAHIRGDRIPHRAAPQCR